MKVCKYLMGGNIDKGASLFSVVPGDRTSGNGTRKHFSTV